MAYFPVFLDLSQKSILVIGGGKVATRKLEKLLMFSPRDVSVVAKSASDGFKALCLENSIEINLREFDWNDLTNQQLIIVAVDDLNLQKNIFEKCKEDNILCNCVDSSDLCNFIFPAVVKRGDLCVGINTSGRAPYLSKRIRQLIDGLLPESLGETIKLANSYRKSIDDKKASSDKIKAHIDELLKKIGL